MQRTPPKSPKTPRPGQSQSQSVVPDIASALSKDNSNANITIRGKRQRIEDSPNSSVLRSPCTCTCSELKNELRELKELMTVWKSENDLSQSAWKAEHDAVLSALVHDVAEIKNQCAVFLKTTYKPEVSVPHANWDHLRTKVTGPEKRLTNVQDPQLQSHPVTGQLPIVSPNCSGTIIAHTEVMPEGRNMDDLSTRNMDVSDIHSSSEQSRCRAPKHRVSVPLPVPVTDLLAGDTARDGPAKDGWVEVRHRRPRRSLGNVLRGTAAPGATGLEASERRRYLHLFYVKQGTTESQVRQHLITLCGTDVCTVEALKPRGDYASFKLGVPSKLADQVMAAQNWAEDICVKPWRRNFRPRSDEAQETA